MGDVVRSIGPPPYQHNHDSNVKLNSSIGAFTDDASFNAFIHSEYRSYSSVNVLTRSGKSYDSACSTCNRHHPFNFVCGPMVGMDIDAPDAGYFCPDGRSQCERICWCEAREYFLLRKRLSVAFRAWRASILVRELNIPNAGFPAVVIQP